MKHTDHKTHTPHTKYLDHTKEGEPMNNEMTVTKDVESMKSMFDSLSDYFTLEPFNSYFARLEVKQTIPTDAGGTNTVEPGIYFMDADSKLYQTEHDDNAPMPNARKVTPFVRNGTQLVIANLIFYIGEYMTMPTVANEYFDNFFPQGVDHITADLQNVVMPTEIVAPIDRVTRSYFENKLKPNHEVTVKSGHDITVTTGDGKKEKQPLAPKVTVSLLELPPEIKVSREPMPFDNDVFNAVCSLHESGNARFTGHDIYRTMTGNPDAKATEETLQLIDDAWTRLTTTTMRLDSGTMGNAYGFAQYIRDRRIVEGGRDKAIVENQHGHFEVVVYTILEKPTLLEYAQLLNQVSRFPTIEQNTPVNKNLEILAVQNALLEHIHAIPRLSNHILYDTLYSLLDLEGKADNYIKLKKKRTRDAVHKMLNYWKKQGVIASWKDIKKGNAFYAIEVNTRSTPKALNTPKT